ncbi:reverse transcriptase family protein [Naumannella halotolerans]|uniref:reverse transcriptase family protein n=1 Tax=Naumannella halotolerans TaxID=993414 RepID=UPI00370D0282
MSRACSAVPRRVRLHLYRYRWITRPGRTPRLLEVPTPLQRAVSRRINDRILALVPHHRAAHGHRPGRSVLTGARPHVGQRLVLGMDLRHFFAAVGSARVGGIFAQLGYPEPVVRALTGLSTHRVPGAVLRAMPAGGDSTARYRLRALWRAAHLPQGSPTAPALANLTCFRLDRRLAGYAERSGLVYTRYVDDLTFSGARCAVPAMVAGVSRIVAEEGFTVNPAKTRVQRSGVRQQVTGLVTNQVLRPPRQYRDRLRAVLHDARCNGAEAANREGHPDFAAHLRGRIAWLAATDPQRAERFWADYARIDFGDNRGAPAGGADPPEG